MWEKFDFTLTPTSVGTITATVTFAGAAGGTAYLDAVYQFPFITENWIYGFQRLAQVNSVVDANVTLSESSVAALTTISTYDAAYDAATYSAVVAGPAAGAYTVIATASGTTLDFGANTVAINSAAANAFAYSPSTATIKAAALVAGSKFTTLKAGSHTWSNSVGAGSYIGNVSQATPTNLTGVNITGNLVFNTNTPTTVTFTSCNVSGTISNSGTGLVKIVKAGTTPWLTAGSNVSVIANVVVETPGGLALSTYIVKNGATDLGWVAGNTGRLLEINQTDTFQIYAIAYGYKAKLVAANALDLTSFKFELLPEAFIDTSLSTTTRNLIASKFSTALDAYNRIALSLDTDLRYYTPDEVMNAVQYYIVTQGNLIAAGVLYGGTINGVEIIQGGFLVSTPGFYGKVADSVTTTNDLGILVPIFIDVLPAVYTADPTYSAVRKNTSGIILQSAPWTKMTADISSVDKTDIRRGLATEDNVTAVRVKTDANLDTTVSSRLSAAAYSPSGGSGGSGGTAPTAAENAAAVRTELATELGRIDVASSTRLAAASYTAPDNTSVAAIKAKTDANLDAAVSTRLAASAYTAPTPAPTSTDVAAAVRVELAAELARLDVATSTRLATTAYTAPTSAPTSAQVAAAVRVELAAELARLDAAVTSRLAAASYTAPGTAPTSAQNAAAVRSELATELARIDAAVSSRLAATSYSAPISSATIATAVRNEIAVELARLDVPTSTRLADADFVEPDNASITAIKANAALIPALL